MKCKICGSIIDNNASVCNQCGSIQDQGPNVSINDNKKATGLKLGSSSAKTVKTVSNDKKPQMNWMNKAIIVVMILIVISGGCLIALIININSAKDDVEEKSEESKKEENNDEELLESQKQEYLDSGASFINAVIKKVNNQGSADGLTLTDPSKVYYIPVSNDPEYSCVLLEKGGKTPYGSWWKTSTAEVKTTVPVDADSSFAYVVVVMNDEGTKYSYGFVAKDTAKHAFDLTKEGTPAWNKENVKPSGTITMPDDGDPVTLPAELKVGNSATDLDTVYYVVDKLGACVPASSIAP